MGKMEMIVCINGCELEHAETRGSMVQKKNWMQDDHLFKLNIITYENFLTIRSN